MLVAISESLSNMPTNAWITSTTPIQSLVTRRGWNCIGRRVANLVFATVEAFPVAGLAADMLKQRQCFECKKSVPTIYFAAHCNLDHPGMDVSELRLKSPEGDIVERPYSRDPLRQLVHGGYLCTHPNCKKQPPFQNDKHCKDHINNIHAKLSDEELAELHSSAIDEPVVGNLSFSPARHLKLTGL